MSLRLKIAFYAETIEPIGGIETWFYYVSTDLQKYHDITVFYNRADLKQISRLEENGIKCLRLTTEPDETFDILFRSYSGNSDIKAKYYVQTLHACFSEMPDYKFIPWGKTTSYLAVSERAKASFLELYPDEKLPIDVVPNYVPIRTIPMTKPFNGTINMVMASRLTKEKGLRHLMDMVKVLDKKRINYHIDLFTVFQKMPHLDNGKVTCIPPRLDIDFSKYHYLVQLSDTESYGYSIHEALSSGTAVIVQDIPALKGVVKHGYNGYIYPDVDNITDVPVRFDYKPTGSVNVWLKYIENVVK